MEETKPEDSTSKNQDNKADKGPNKKRNYWVPLKSP